MFRSVAKELVYMMECSRAYSLRKSREIEQNGLAFSLDANGQLQWISEQVIISNVILFAQGRDSEYVIIIFCVDMC